MHRFAWSAIALILLTPLFFSPSQAQTSVWQTEIYDNIWLNGDPVVRRTDGNIAFQWDGNSPHGGISADFFSMRWTSNIYLNEAGRVRFKVRADDGIRVFIDGQTALYAWDGQAKVGAAADKWLEAGNHTVVVEYYEHSSTAYAYFDYEVVEVNSERPDLIPTPIPTQPFSNNTPVPVNNPANNAPAPTSTPQPQATQPVTADTPPTVEPTSPARLPTPQSGASQPQPPSTAPTPPDTPAPPCNSRICAI